MRLVWLNVFIVSCMASSLPLVARMDVDAQQLQSPRYRIESESLSLQQDLEQGSANYDISSSFGPQSQKQFESRGYVAVSRVKTDSSDRSYLRLQLSNSQLVFDKADIVDESIQKTSVKLTGISATPFIVAVRQAEQFKNSFGATVMSTNCDDKSSPCTPTLAREWKTGFGFGYRVDRTTVGEFSSKYAFRPLYQGYSSGKSAMIFRGDVNKDGQKLDLEFKLRPQPQTQTGIYQSTIIITATTDF